MATYNHVNGPVVPHLDTTAASSSSGGTGAAYVIISLLGVNKKRGSNRGGNNKRSHCSCHGCGTSPAFVVGLLDVDDKMGATGTLVRWQGGSGGGAGPAFVAGLLGVEVKDKRVSG